MGQILHRLSARELQVVNLLRGWQLSNKEIAREMGIDVNTIKIHVRNACQKLQAKNRAHLAVIGCRELGFAQEGEAPSLEPPALGVVAGPFRNIN